MANNEIELNDHFQVSGETKLPPDVLGELQSILRLHSMTPQELFYKWESYCIKLGADTKLDLDTARLFKKDIQDVFDTELRSKPQIRGTDKRTVHATPRAGAGGDDVFGMFDTVTPKTPYTATKRKEAFETPVAKSARSARKSSPGGYTTPAVNGSVVPFAERQNAGAVLETINDHLQAAKPLEAPFAQSRTTITSNSDLPKFKYRPLAMHLSEASEILDDRIDEFTISVQKYHKLDEGIFGNAASKSTNEIVAVGRIASDTPDSKLNAASIVLESSRRMGAGMRIPLKLDTNVSGDFYPGQIVALRGSNTTGDYFTVSEILDIPIQPPSAFSASAIYAVNERLGEDGEIQPLNVIISSGPYTTDDNLEFEPLKELCRKVSEVSADILVLIGPFLDIEHPLIATGDFELPDSAELEPDISTMSDVFRVLIGTPIRQIIQDNPSLTVLIIPSTRDTVNKHVAWPQAAFDRKGLGLPPKRAMCVPNPVTLTINDFVLGVSAQDVLWDLRKEELNIGKPKENNMLTRLSQHVIRQGHFYPLFPPANRANLPKPGYEDGIATGTPMDTAYLKLGEFPNVRPDLLILPSALPPYLRATEGVFVVNPGTLSKRKGPGTFAQLSIHPRKLDEEESSNPSQKVGSRLYDRARADIIRI